MIAVVGARSLIGSAILDATHHLGLPVVGLTRDDPVPAGLDVAVYCLGTTGAHADQLRATVDSHLTRLVDLIEAGGCGRIVHLSSLSVSRLSPSPVGEQEPVVLDPRNPLDLYGLSKATAEAILHASDVPTTILRLAKVYGDPPATRGFLDEVLRAAASGDELVLRSPASAAKDYVDIADVVGVVLRCATDPPPASTYNVGVGENVSNGQIIDVLRAQGIHNVRAGPDGPAEVYPQLDTTLVRRHFDFRPVRLVDRLPGLVDAYRNANP